MTDIQNQTADSKPSFADNEAKASVAFTRYSALMQAWREDQSLMDEECFQILLDDAKRSFGLAFDALI